MLEDNDAPETEGGDSSAQKAAKAALRAKFHAWLMPEDFVEDLRADFDALTAANDLNQSDYQSGWRTPMRSARSCWR